MINLGTNAHASQDRCRHLGDADRSVAAAVAHKAQGYINSFSWLCLLVRFSEKVFDARPDVLDQPLHVGVVTHATHVDHVDAKVA